MSKVAIQGNASGTGTFTIAAPNSNTDRTLTLPDEAGTVLTSASTLSSSNLSGALPALDGSALTGVSAGKILQVATYNKNDRVRAQITDNTTFPSSTTGALFTSFNFTPVASDSTLILQSSIFHIIQEANIGDLIYCLAYYDSTVIGHCNPYTSYVPWNGSIDTTFVAFNHAFSSWGTSQKTIGIRFGIYNPSSYNTEYLRCNSPANTTYDFFSSAYHDVGFTIIEVAA